MAFQPSREMSPQGRLLGDLIMGRWKNAAVGLLVDLFDGVAGGHDVREAIMEIAGDDDGRLLEEWQAAYGKPLLLEMAQECVQS
jgi:hypothetical protein